MRHVLVLCVIRPVYTTVKTCQTNKSKSLSIWQQISTKAKIWNIPRSLELKLMTIAHNHKHFLNSLQIWSSHVDVKAAFSESLVLLSHQYQPLLCNKVSWLVLFITLVYWLLSIFTFHYYRFEIEVMVITRLLSAVAVNTKNNTTLTSTLFAVLS